MTGRPTRAGFGSAAKPPLTMATQAPIALASWQQEFVDRFISDPKPKSLLVAAAGTGKSITTLTAAGNLIQRGVVDRTLVISDRSVLRDQWREVATRCGMTFARTFDELGGESGISATVQSLRSEAADTLLRAAARAQRWFIVADESPQENRSVTAIVDVMLALNPGSKALFIAGSARSERSVEAEFTFGPELFLGRSIVGAASTERTISRFSPSFSLIRRLHAGIAAVDDFTWREFERLIATLLEGDGYSVELMRGTKDGGVDVVAVKDLGVSGYFKTVWQAKKRSLRNRVQLSVVRELADTRLEFGASKGIIVTSSHLTRGALQRIERDKYLLGKIDRDDLDAWIRKTLFPLKTRR